MKKFLFFLICAVVSVNAFGVSEGESCADGQGVWWFFESPGKMTSTWMNYSVSNECIAQCGGQNDCLYCVDNSTSTNSNGFYICLSEYSSCTFMYTFLGGPSGWTSSDGQVYKTSSSTNSTSHVITDTREGWSSSYGSYRCAYSKTSTYRCASSYYGNPTSSSSGCSACSSLTTSYVYSGTTGTTKAKYSSGGGGTSSSSCYMPYGSGTTYHDSKGKFYYPSACYYSNY